MDIRDFRDGTMYTTTYATIAAAHTAAENDPYTTAFPIWNSGNGFWALSIGDGPPAADLYILYNSVVYFIQLSRALDYTPLTY